MFRIQAFITLALLLAAETDSFSTSTVPGATTTSRSLLQQQQQLLATSASWRNHQLSAPAFLHASQYDFRNESSDKVNNRHSSNDYWYNIRTLPSSSILRDIRNPVLAVFGWSAVVSVVHCLMAKSGQSLLQSFANKLCVSSAAHSYLVSSLGLLLVFRTNSAYQRFNVSPISASPNNHSIMSCSVLVFISLHTLHVHTTGRTQDLGTDSFRVSESISVDQSLWK